jgi:hypothetical protein
MSHEPPMIEGAEGARQAASGVVDPALGSDAQVGRNRCPAQIH